MSRPSHRLVQSIRTVPRVHGEPMLFSEVERRKMAVFNPWDRLTEPEAIAELLKEAGVSAVDVAAESGRQQLSIPEDWWTMVLGCGLRWTVEQLGPEAADRVKRHNLAWARDNGVDEVETNVIYAVATKPAAEP